jgi:hypothetical protein
MISFGQMSWSNASQTGTNGAAHRLVAAKNNLYYNGLSDSKRAYGVSSEEWPRDGNWTHDDVLRLATRQAEKISELRDQLRDAQSALYRTEDELREARERLGREGQMRSSIEVLQRMANGLDPYDAGRFKCAVAALPHETPKLSASVSMIGTASIADRLDAFNRDHARKRAEDRGLRVIEPERCVPPPVQALDRS